MSRAFHLSACVARGRCTSISGRREHDPTVQQRVTRTLVSRSGRRRLVRPESPKSIRRQRCIPGRRLQVPMPEVMRQRPSVLAIVRELVAGRMPQHVRMYSEGEARRAGGALDHPQEPSRCYWRSGLGHEHIRARPLQRSQGSKLRPMQRMNAGAAALRAVDVQPALSKIDLRPAKATKLGSAEAMPIGQQDRASIPSAIPPSLARSLDQPIKGTNPEELIAAAHAGCFTMALAFGLQSGNARQSPHRSPRRTASTTPCGPALRRSGRCPS